LIVAALAGDQVNFATGRWLGPRLLEKPNRFIKKAHIERTQKFYEKHGGKTIIYARFVPIIRTFAPFVAGLAKMDPKRFSFFNVIGGISWIVSFLYLGFFFGNQPAVKDNFGLVILAIIVVSLLPAVVEVIRMRRMKQQGEL